MMKFEKMMSLKSPSIMRNICKSPNPIRFMKNILKREKAIDFAHLQKDALEIVKKDGFKTQFSNILIDEFQDTDPMQMELFEYLMKQAKSFTVVGDINQSIYWI